MWNPSSNMHPEMFSVLSLDLVCKFCYLVILFLHWCLCLRLIFELTYSEEWSNVWHSVKYKHWPIRVNVNHLVGAESGNSLLTCPWPIGFCILRNWFLYIEMVHGGMRVYGHHNTWRLRLETIWLSEQKYFNILANGIAIMMHEI